jgi:mannose-6-phosphate isomerase-like protein (cupin superfamily)
VLGGFFTDWLSWRVGFLVNVPIGIAAMLAAPRYLAETERHPGRFDLASGLNSTLGAGLLVYGIVRSATAGWGDTVTVTSLLAGALLLALFAADQSRAAQPVIPLARVAARAARLGLPHRRSRTARARPSRRPDRPPTPIRPSRLPGPRDRGRLARSKEHPMQITKNSVDTRPDQTTGSPARSSSTPSRLRRLPRAGSRQRPLHARRTQPRTHPFGQTIYVTEGIGHCQRRGGPIEVIRPGDRVFVEPGEHHWHGAAPNRFMTHLAIQEADDSGSRVTWGEHVTDEQYAAAPAISG